MKPRSRSKQEQMRQAARRAGVRAPYVRQNPLDVPLVPSRTCQFMGGMDISKMCGEKSVTGFSYCEEHRAICYLGSKPV